MIVLHVILQASMVRIRACVRLCGRLSLTVLLTNHSAVLDSLISTAGTMPRCRALSGGIHLNGLYI